MLPNGENIFHLNGNQRFKNKFGTITMTCRETGQVWRLKHRLINDRFGRGQAFCNKIEDRGYIDLDHWTWINRRELAAKFGVKL